MAAILSLFAAEQQTVYAAPKALPDYLAAQAAIANATIKLQPPQITTHPQNKSVIEGQTASFTVAATGSGTLKYQWQLRRPPYISNFADISSTNSQYTGASSPTLQVAANTTASNGNRYRCVVSNALGSATSNTATLTVNAVAPAITTHPQSKSVSDGQAASFTVAASGSGTLKYQWQVRRPPYTVDFADIASTNSQYTGASSPTLKVTAPTTASNNNRYRCVVSNSAGSATSNTATLTVNATAPTITTQPENQSVAVGQTATFFVAASGSGTLKYQWEYYHRDGVWLDTELAGFSGMNTATLKVQATDASMDGRRFRCEVSNAVGSVYSNEAKISVTPDAPIITAHPQNKSVTEGQAATFSVSATGTGTLSYQWEYYHRDGVWLEADTEGFSGMATPTLKVTTSDTSLNGRRLRVEVSNAGGSVYSNEAKITVTAAASSAATSTGQSEASTPSGSSTSTAAQEGQNGASSANETASGDPAELDELANVDLEEASADNDSNLLAKRFRWEWILLLCIPVMAFIIIAQNRKLKLAKPGMPICGNCGAKVQTGTKFCPECGKPMGVLKQDLIEE